VFFKLAVLLRETELQTSFLYVCLGCIFQNTRFCQVIGAHLVEKQRSFAFLSCLSNCVHHLSGTFKSVHINHNNKMLKVPAHNGEVHEPSQKELHFKIFSPFPSWHWCTQIYFVVAFVETVLKAIWLLSLRPYITSLTANKPRVLLFIGNKKLQKLARSECFWPTF